MASKASVASNQSTAPEGGDQQPPEEAVKPDPAQNMSGIYESVEIIPPVHTTCYKVWVVGCSCWMMLFIPVSFTLFASGYKPTRATTAPPLTTDPDWLNDTQGPCLSQFGTSTLGTGSAKRPTANNPTPRTSTVFCLFNTSTHLRPVVARMVVGQIPGFLCKHVLYSAVVLSDQDAELAPKTSEFDTECQGLASVKTLKRLYQNIKVHAVLSAHSSQDAVALYNVAKDTAQLDKLVLMLKNWVKKYEFDGLFVSWSDPFDQKWAKVFYAKLSQELRPIMTLGAIVPSDFAKLANFDVADLEAQVDWLVAKTHGFFPAPKYNYTSCPSPYEQPDGPRKNLSVMGVLDYHLAMLGQRMNLSRFCFTVSFRATGYKVTGGSMDYRMAVRGPGNLNRYTGDDGILAYNQLCKRVYQSRNSTSDLCSYVYVREDQTWAAFESPWSIAAKVDKVRSYLGSQVSPPANQFCVGVWDLDLDDYRPKCSKSKKWPLLEALVAALP